MVEGATAMNDAGVSAITASTEKEKTGLDVLRLKEREIQEDGFRRFAGCKIRQDMLNREPLAAQNGLAAEDLGVRGDPRE